MTIRELHSRHELQEFVRFPLHLYSGNPWYIPPILKDETNYLFAGINSDGRLFRARYWIAEDHGKIKGRIAGLITKKEASAKEVRFGWLDFTRDEETLNLLLQAVETWAKNEGADTVHGPMGFSSFDRSGILYKGFDELPSCIANYNYPYYQELIETIGYQKEFDWVEYRIRVPDLVPARIVRGAQVVKDRYKVKLAEVQTKKDLIPFVPSVIELINLTYSHLSGFTPLTRKQFNELLKQFYLFIHPDFTAMVINQDAELVGFGIAIPSMSRALIKMHGALFPLGYWHLYKALGHIETLDLLLIAIRPEYQKKGITALIFEKIISKMIEKKVKYVETTKELENNSSIQNLWGDFKFIQHRRSRCYIKKLMQ